jgi:hypothetical protein
MMMDKVTDAICINCGIVASCDMLCQKENPVRYDGIKQAQSAQKVIEAVGEYVNATIEGTKFTRMLELERNIKQAYAEYKGE